MYPHERSLVKRLAGQPFILVGINSDKSLKTVQDAMEREQMTWPSWYDGGSTGGPIATLYQVRSWPTLYVLDPNGTIRYKDVRGEALDQAVDQLLEEFAQSGADSPTNPPRARSKTPRRRETTRGKAGQDARPSPGESNKSDSKPSDTRSE